MPRRSSVKPPESVKDSDLLRSIARQLRDCGNPKMREALAPTIAQLIGVAERMDKPVPPPVPTLYKGYTMYDAVQKAVDIGTLGAWEWLQAWWKADLEDDSEPPEDW